MNKGVPLADLWLPVRINGDMAALRGMMKEMFSEEKAPGRCSTASSFESTRAGLTVFLEHLNATSWDDIVAGSGLTCDQIRQAAEIAMSCKRIICCWAMGLTQHKNAVATIQEVMNFLLLWRPHRPARRGTLPGARPLEYAGRSHDGHLGADE